MRPICDVRKYSRIHIANAEIANQLADCYVPDNIKLYLPSGKCANIGKESIVSISLTYVADRVGQVS